MNFDFFDLFFTFYRFVLFSYDNYQDQISICFILFFSSVFFLFKPKWFKKSLSFFFWEKGLSIKLFAWIGTVVVSFLLSLWFKSFILNFSEAHIKIAFDAYDKALFFDDKLLHDCLKNKTYQTNEICYNLHKERVNLMKEFSFLFIHGYGEHTVHLYLDFFEEDFNKLSGIDYSIKLKPVF